MTRCASPSLFAGIASFLSARTGGRFRLIIGFEAPEDQDSARDGAAIIEAAGGHALLMPRALPAPLTAFSVRMVMADGAVYVRASGETLSSLSLTRPWPRSGMRRPSRVPRTAGSPWAMG